PSKPRLSCRVPVHVIFRSTFCSVMSQLTEETQPSFETTLKSKAVSESCNVKFTCVVTGYPAPEITWYKDDAELDRYCGLPKYEIFHSGKSHTLHIYNCTLDDAAIYQASARNNKGIVSCSGVLEVGDMNEYKIHQRFFAKLKQKAENKRREQEESRRRGKENIQQEQLNALSQDRILRKRRSPGGTDPLSSPPSAQEEEEPITTQEVMVVENPVDETNGAVVGKTPDMVKENQDSNHLPNGVEIISRSSPTKEKMSKKKIRISNGFDEGTVISSQSSGKDKDTNSEGISLAQYLTETLQSQAREESARLHETMEVDSERQHESDKEHAKVRERLRDEERQREKERERLRESEQTRDIELSPKAESKRGESKHSAKKESESKSSITSVFYSLKDIFFGKNKKDLKAPEDSKGSHQSHMVSEEVLLPTSQIRVTQPDIPSGVNNAIPEAAVTMEPETQVDQLQKDKPVLDKLAVKPPVAPTMSPSSLRRLLAKNNSSSETALTGDPDKKGEDSGGSTPTSSLSCESSPKLRRRDSLTLIRSATPEELASGARRKIYLSKMKDDTEGSLDNQGRKDAPYMSPNQARRAAFLQAQAAGQQTPPMERRSPLLSRRKATLEVPKTQETPETTKGTKPTEQDKQDPFKAPQVIRKIRGEPFSDATGHLKLWCQFFNVLSDSFIKWYRDEVELLEVKRSAGDESPFALAIVQASSRDCGVYTCTIKNDYGSDTTDFLLSPDILTELLLKEDTEAGEEIEMTPLLFTKGLADSGYWGNKFFGRIITQEMHLGESCVHKTCRVKVIYGLDPIFESGSMCIIKVRNPIAYGTKEENSLIERNQEIIKQECKVQNTLREYLNIPTLLHILIPVYLMYRPANTVPYATVEADLKGVYLRYCLIDASGRLISRTTSEVEQKCCTFQHWIHQWTNGNLLAFIDYLAGVDSKITNIRIATKSKGYQGLTEEASPKMLEQFLTQHQCNYYCGLLGLRPLKSVDSLQQPAKMKGSRSPLLNRKVGTGSSSPQLQKKGLSSPQMAKKSSTSPKVARKTGETEDTNAPTKHKTVEIPKTVRMR
uniref:non-specific serine/threonine protein kinase n=1 Tax=Denticeps clupeoides TaxID=299321 RepID=A0AAY4C2W1_9TELE